MHQKKKNAAEVQEGNCSWDSARASKSRSTFSVFGGTALRVMVLLYYVLFGP